MSSYSLDFQWIDLIELHWREMSKVGLKLTTLTALRLKWYFVLDSRSCSRSGLRTELLPKPVDPGFGSQGSERSFGHDDLVLEGLGIGEERARLGQGPTQSRRQA